MATAQQFRSATERIISKSKESLTGKDAWRQNLNLASLAAFKIGSCLGPTGAYKLVTYHRGPQLVMKVTKDAVDMVDELGVQYPAIKTLAEAAKIQREYVGDGVSTMLVLISALLAEADKLIEMGFHANTILQDITRRLKNRRQSSIKLQAPLSKISTSTSWKSLTAGEAFSVTDYAKNYPR